MSLKSISVDETPDLECKPLHTDLQPVSEVEKVSSIDVSIQNNIRDKTLKVLFTPQRLPLPEYDTEDTATNEESSEDMVQSSNSDSNPPPEIENVIKPNLSPGRVVRRKKHSAKNSSARASFPQTRSKNQSMEKLHIMSLSISSSHEDDSMNSSTDRLEG